MLTDVIRRSEQWSIRMLSHRRRTALLLLFGLRGHAEQQIGSSVFGHVSIWSEKHRYTAAQHYLLGIENLGDSGWIRREIGNLDFEINIYQSKHIRDLELDSVQETIQQSYLSLPTYMLHSPLLPSPRSLSILSSSILRRNDTPENK